MAEDPQNPTGSESSGDVKVSVITCEPVVDISVVDELYQHLKKSLLEKHEVEFEAGEVTRIDGAVLQLLCIFFRDACASGMTVRWKRVSANLREAANSLGVSELLQLPTNT